jgi:hypothetical protein
MSKPMSESPVPAVPRLGELLVEAGAIDAATLEQALERSHRSGRKLGETLIEAGAISGEVLQRFLRRQRRLATLAMAGVALSAALQTPAGAADRAQVQIHATVPAKAFIDRQRLPQRVVVSAQDVARGYLDVDEPVEVGIRTNHPGGVVLGIASNSRQLERIDVRAAEGGLLRAAGIFVPQLERGLRARIVSLKLRLKLAPGTVPGSIAYPFSLFLAPA